MNKFYFYYNLIFDSQVLALKFKIKFFIDTPEIFFQTSRTCLLIKILISILFIKKIKKYSFLLAKKLYL
jgi:hypothetical protein